MCTRFAYNPYHHSKIAHVMRVDGETRSVWRTPVREGKTTIHTTGTRKSISEIGKRKVYTSDRNTHTSKSSEPGSPRFSIVPSTSSASESMCACVWRIHLLPGKTVRWPPTKSSRVPLWSFNKAFKLCYKKAYARVHTHRRTHTIKSAKENEKIK